MMSSELILVKYCNDGYVIAVLETTGSAEDAAVLEGMVTLLDAGSFGVLFPAATPVIKVLRKGLELAPLLREVAVGIKETKH